eukprot:CAMPEP_0117536800 /NCGR_PEP_ID=MMETSP0784-20121206/41637_1 /TAXON_ID=39447 /ORGANISM="" /LENGTH=158 /DNA_ID=CAMNT_0005333369 /DNA_START=77 /DNA_END=553 /DNA_ORIENTATION=-
MLAVIALAYLMYWVVLLVLANMKVEDVMKSSASMATQMPSNSCDAEMAAESTPPGTINKLSKHQRRKLRRARMPKLMRFFLADDDSEAENDDGVGPFDLDNSVWITVSTAEPEENSVADAPVHFIGDDTLGDSACSEAFVLDDDVWRAPPAPLAGQGL